MTWGDAIALTAGAFLTASSALAVTIGIQATRIRRTRTSSQGVADGRGGRLLDPQEEPGDGA